MPPPPQLNHEGNVEAKPSSGTPRVASAIAAENVLRSPDATAPDERKERKDDGVDELGFRSSPRAGATLSASCDRLDALWDAYRDDKGERILIRTQKLWDAVSRFGVSARDRAGVWSAWSGADRLMRASLKNGRGYQRILEDVDANIGTLAADLKQVEVRLSHIIGLPNDYLNDWLTLPSFPFSHSLHPSLSVSSICRGHSPIIPGSKSARPTTAAQQPRPIGHPRSPR